MTRRAPGLPRLSPSPGHPTYRSGIRPERAYRARVHYTVPLKGSAEPLDADEVLRALNAGPPDPAVLQAVLAGLRRL